MRRRPTRSGRVAQALAERNLGPERPILILSGNAIEHQLLGLAAMCAGVPFASISVAYSLVSQDLSKLKYITKLLDPGLVYAADAARFARALDHSGDAGPRDRRRHTLW